MAFAREWSVGCLGHLDNIRGLDLFDPVGLVGSFELY